MKLTPSSNDHLSATAEAVSLCTLRRAATIFSLIALASSASSCGRKNPVSINNNIDENHQNRTKRSGVITERRI